MEPYVIIIWSILLAFGFWCGGYLVGYGHVQRWKIRWIELEHDSARALGKEPRNIDDVFND